MEKKNVNQNTLSQNNLIDEVIDAFTRMNTAIHTLSVLTSLETGLTLSELAASEHLRLDGPLTPKEISRRIHLSTGATTGMLDRLEQRGIIGRRLHPNDRRSILVHYLDPKSVSSDRFEKLQQLLIERLSKLDESQQQVFLAFFRETVTDIDEAT